MLQYFSFRPLGLLALLAACCYATSVSTLAATDAKPVTRGKLAPADQYFGRSKMSIVGMHTAIVKLGERYHAREIDDTDLVHDAKIVEAALYRWHDIYPKDSGAIVTAFELEQLYQAVQSTNARSHATAVLKFIAKAAPKSRQAHLSRLRLAQGFPPLVAETATHATPDPYVREAVAASPSPAAADPSPATPALPSASTAPMSPTSPSPATPLATPT
jgi:hypothetical protein